MKATFEVGVGGRGMLILLLLLLLLLYAGLLLYLWGLWVCVYEFDCANEVILGKGT